MKKKKLFVLIKIKNFFLLLLQRLWITIELFNRNGLVNHAAAGAYGFLFSAAPALIIISFFVNHALVAYPELAGDLFGDIAFLSGIVNVEDLINNFLSAANPGVAGLISGIAILWTVRLCARSIQRGLNVIFSGSRSNPFRNTVVLLGLGFFIILFIFIMLLGTKFASDFYIFPAFTFMKPFHSPVTTLPIRIFFMLWLPLMTLAAYYFVPSKSPKFKHAIAGTIVCIVFYQIFSACFGIIIGPDRYNLLYGALGRLFLFLIDVYFFFSFFFFGAQMIQVFGSSAALFFIRFRAVHFLRSGGKYTRLNPSIVLRDLLFRSIPRPLEKYLRTYRQGEMVLFQGSPGQEVYYIISGEAGVYLDDEFRNRIALIGTAQFFGETEVITQAGRCASIKAETDLSVMCLPPDLFRKILRLDPDTDQNIIKALSEQISSIDRQVNS